MKSKSIVGLLIIWGAKDVNSGFGCAQRILEDYCCVVETYSSFCLRDAGGNGGKL